MPPYLEHIIRETGHRHYMALEEVHPETLDYLRPLLRTTLDTGETVQLPHTAMVSPCPNARRAAVCVALVGHSRQCPTADHASRAIRSTVLYSLDYRQRWP